MKAAQQIPLSHGGFALVNLEDAELVTAHRWHIHNRGYAATHVQLPQGRGLVLMHRLIFGQIPDGYEVDHINHNKLDNRRCNLRVVTHAANMVNRRDSRMPSSGHRNINWEDDRHKWAVRIQRTSHHVWVGRYDRLEDAIAARDQFLNDWEERNRHLFVSVI